MVKFWKDLMKRDPSFIRLHFKHRSMNTDVSIDRDVARRFLDVFDDADTTEISVRCGGVVITVHFDCHATEAITLRDIIERKLLAEVSLPDILNVKE